MQIMVTEQRNENGRVNFEMICGKKAAYVGYHAELGTIDVLCKNASHKVWKGMGRRFWGGWSEAKAAYKSPEMRAMIEHAEDACKPHLTVFNG